MFTIIILLIINYIILIISRYQYTVFCCGRSSPTGRFYATHLALSSKEDTPSWVRVYAWVKTIFPAIPRYII